MVWPKLSVSNYRETLRKLSTSAFFVTAACVWLLRSQISAVDEFLRPLDVTTAIRVFDSVSVPFGTFAVAAVVAIVSESTKLHDKISDALRIRAVFDVHWILIPMALLVGAQIQRARAERITVDRSRLMGEVFYRYASSAKEGEIDAHLIIQALTAWSWYWLCVETIAILLPTAALLVWFGQWKPAAIVMALVLVLQLLMRVFRADANKYADVEVNEILQDEGRRQVVRAAFDAL